MRNTAPKPTAIKTIRRNSTPRARELEKDADLTRRKADRSIWAKSSGDRLVITSITLLSGRRVYWHLGLLMATAGIVVAASAWIVH